MIFYSNQKPQRETSAAEILLRIERFLKMEQKISDEKINIRSTISQPIIDRLYPDVTLRRIHATLKVAEIFAIERQSPKIEISDLNRAEKWTLTGFLQLERGMS